MMKRIGIVAALAGELKPLVDTRENPWQREGELRLGRIGDAECVAASCGMGVEPARRACELVSSRGHLDALLSIGWAGALTCALKPPGAYPIGEIVDSLTDERIQTATPDGFRLLTLDHVTRYGEKRKLAERYQTPLVDMEAATVARFAREKGIAFYCYKGISDDAMAKLPDFNRFIGKDGQMRMPAFVTYALLHPQYWAALKQMGENSRVAASNLAALVSESLTKTL